MPRVAHAVLEHARIVRVLLARFTGPQTDQFTAYTASTTTSHGTIIPPTYLHTAISTGHA
eukprot:6195647-Pleurochrysis_carterae.AAC.2